MVSFDQKASLFPPPINPLPSALSPSSTPRNESSPSLSVTPPPPTPLSSPPPSPHSATWAVFQSLRGHWPLCSWRHSVWKVRTPARGKGLMMSCQLVRPQGHYVTARNNMADCNPLQAAPVSLGSHPYGETKELLLDVFATRTSGRHEHCTWKLV